MDTIKKFWPHAFKAVDVKSLIITILLYIVADVICGAVIGLLGKIPLLGILFSLVGAVLGIYFFVGIVFALLSFFKILK